MSLYEEQPIVYVNINMNDLRSADACINFPIAEITYDGDLLETFDHNDESFGHFFARKILVGSKLFIKGFSSASQTQIDPYSISQLGLKKLLLIDELESFNEKQPGVVNLRKINLKKWIGNAMYDNLVNWANNLHLFKGLIINEDYKIRISKKIAVNLNKFPEVNLISDRTYPKMIMPSTNLEVILISNNIFSIKDLSTFPFIKKMLKIMKIIFIFYSKMNESALNSLKPLKALQDIFNEYGHLFPQRIILGKSLKKYFSK
ncbi:unnamed protein product [Rhizophagus irregularis]|nr:unnamed protein product [Rhizophagus irregularis]